MIFVWLLACNIVLTDPSMPFWVTTAFYAVQLIGWLGIAAYGLWKGSRPILPLLLWVWIFIISWMDYLPTSVELIRILGFIGLYSLNFDADKLRKWADWILPLIFVLPLFSGSHNNDISMLVWVVLMVSNRRGWWIIAAGAVMIALHSEAALVALLVGVAVERWGYKALLPAPVAMLIIGLLRPYGIMHDGRILLWQYALEKFTFFGNGIPFRFHATGYNFGQGFPTDIPYGYAHSLPVDVLYVAGVPGLALLGLAGWWLWRHRAKFGPWSGFIAGFCVYSLVDYPHWSVPGAVLMIILSKYRKGSENYGKFVGSRIRMFILARAGNRPGLQRGEGMVAISDQRRTQ